MSGVDGAAVAGRSGDGVARHSPDADGAVSADGLAAPPRSLRILFFIRHLIYTRNFESTLRMLAERGHRVHVSLDHLIVDTAGTPFAEELIVRLAREYPGITYGPAPGRADDTEHWTDGWFQLERNVSLWRDFLRYFDPRYDDAPKLRERAVNKAGRGLRELVGLPLVGTPAGRRALGRALAGLEVRLPLRPEVQAFLAEQDPDIVLVTPLVDLGSPQAGYVRTANRAGRRTGLLVHSWDNLTNKGLIHESPDFVQVWNEAQRDEAADMHGIARERVAVTGSPGYDHWFSWTPSRDREELCATVGLRADRPFVLYLCSSYFIAPREAEFVAEWLRRVRAFPGLEEAGVLIRPHPKNFEQWVSTDLSGAGNVAVWPPLGANPLDPQAKADYFDSLYHCGAVMGVNTSALIESAIVGRPVHTLLAPEFRDTQEGTLHFRYLARFEGGMLQVAEGFDEHLAQLAAALAGDVDHERMRRFVRAFVRPQGLDTPATPRVVATVEEACARPAPPAQAPSAWGGGLRVALAPLAFVLAVLHGRYSPPLAPGAIPPSLPRRALRALPGIARAAVGREPVPRAPIEPSAEPVQVLAQAGGPDPDMHEEERPRAGSPG